MRTTSVSVVDDRLSPGLEREEDHADDYTEREEREDLPVVEEGFLDRGVGVVPQGVEEKGHRRAEPRNCADDSQQVCHLRGPEVCRR